MNATTITITLDQVARHIDAELVAEASPLNPADGVALPIVEIVGTRVDIIDGYHRLAGMIAWARQADLSLGSVAVRCATCDDASVLADAANADRPGSQQSAIDRIYAAL